MDRYYIQSRRAHDSGPAFRILQRICLAFNPEVPASPRDLESVSCKQYSVVCITSIRWRLAECDDLAADNERKRMTPDLRIE